MNVGKITSIADLSDALGGIAEGPVRGSNANA
jgi:hypothetical protein